MDTQQVEVKAQEVGMDSQEAVTQEEIVSSEDVDEVAGLRLLLNSILDASLREQSSDIYLKAGNPPYLRIEGKMFPLDCPPLTPQMTEKLALSIAPKHLLTTFPTEKPEANFVYALDGVGRFRVNAYRQRDTIAMVLRRISDDVRTLEELGMPPVLGQLAMEKRGLVLVTGPTGSGKSTTLAAMIRYRKEHAPGHIVTIEDPIEYVHNDVPGCLVSQREVGTDTMCFKDALESALRQAPDVLLIGEMRDQASVEAAVYFAETGHLVLSTLHANNAAQTVERVMQFFPEDMQAPILQQISVNLRGVVAQRLVPTVDGKRTAALEILVGNARMRENIRESHLGNIKAEMDSFDTEGMQSFDKHLLQLVKEGRVEIEDALRASDNYNDLRMKIRHMQKEMAARA